MKKLLFIALFIIGCVSTPPKPPPPQSTMDVIEEELAGWGGADDLFDARWANWKVGYNKDEGNLYIQVAAQPSANDIAMIGLVQTNQHVRVSLLMGFIILIKHALNIVKIILGDTLLVTSSRL